MSTVFTVSIYDTCRLLVGKSEGKRPLGRSRRRWVDSIKMNNAVLSDVTPCDSCKNIKMDLVEIGWGGVD
jgi:hypothetical protein